MPASPPLQVGLERGRTWVFATAVDWPGWCRRGKGDEAAVEALCDYRDRYAVVVGVLSSAAAVGGVPSVGAVGSVPSAAEVEIVGSIAGNASTDFGAPGVPGPWDARALAAADADRLTTLLEASWAYLDGVVAVAPAELRRGPRGGGRDTAAMVAHVQEAERSYGRKIGVRVPPRTPWPDQRAALAAAARGVASGPAWPVRYLIARCAWHVLDHAWEIEDRSA